MTATGLIKYVRKTQQQDTPKAGSSQGKHKPARGNANTKDHNQLDKHRNFRSYGVSHSAQRETNTLHNAAQLWEQGISHHPPNRSQPESRQSRQSCEPELFRVHGELIAGSQFKEAVPARLPTCHDVRKQHTEAENVLHSAVASSNAAKTS